ncbi:MULTISPECIES: SchA/CurD-like domain-containing protein [Actinomadura]|uniref:SchA/CurD-like domain-containing protein n=1 Tax=Actinomadura miaoliensis TaxID=430685 RepID=A0ABP7V3L8_9ACTN
MTEGDAMQRHAVMFRIKPGSQDAVRKLMSGYRAPRQLADGKSRLISTSVFMKDDIVVRMIEIEGDLPTLMRHLSQDPNIQKLERELERHLAEKRDMSTPEGASEYFRKAMMETVTTRMAPPPEPALSGH